jgi:hypothetical protein
MIHQPASSPDHFRAVFGYLLAPIVDSKISLIWRQLFGYQAVAAAGSTLDQYCHGVG